MIVKLTSAWCLTACFLILISSSINQTITQSINHCNLSWIRQILTLIILWSVWLSDSCISVYEAFVWRSYSALFLFGLMLSNLFYTTKVVITAATIFIFRHNDRKISRTRRSRDLPGMRACMPLRLAGWRSVASKVETGSAAELAPFKSMRRLSFFTQGSGLTYLVFHVGSIKHYCLTWVWYVHVV